MPSTTNFGWTTPADTDLVKDGAAAIRTLGNGVDASFVDLKGGTTGQILSKNSNTDLDFTWIANDQGDITAVTAGTGMTGGGTSGAVTLTNDMATTITAAGDIVVGTGSSTYDNLPIGTTGQVLTADTTVSPYKVKWASPASSSPSYTLLNAGGTALTGATSITISSISAKSLLIWITDGGTVNASAEIRVKLNNEDNCNGVYWYLNQTTPGSPSATSAIYLYQTGNNQLNEGQAAIRVDAADTSGYKPVDWVAYGAGTSGYSYLGQGFYKGAAVTSVVLFSASGNFDEGTIYVYGAN